jgi:succinate dehydrogenase / fumarate reductase flavoprotein subunit
MAHLENREEVSSADVLILGGGLAGLIVANKVKELNRGLEVLIVEKATTGFSGSKANKGAGVLWVMQEGDDIDKFRDYFVKEIGHGLEDQELLEKVCVKSLEMVEDLARWGVQIMRDESGKLVRLPDLPYWSLCAYDLDIMDKLRKMAVKQGVKMVDKTQSVELLTEGNRVVGAIGFSILDGTYRIFKGKSVVLANGSCNWMVTNMWYSGRGDGIAAAYRAGAEMRNAEFSNFYNIGLRGNMSCMVGSQYALYNEDDEYLAPRYCKDNEPDIDIGILLGMEKEVMEGKGPIRFEESELFVQNPLAAGGLIFRWERPVALKFWRKLFEKEAKYMADHSWRPEVVPQFIGECAPVKTDHEMRTTLAGLWALGDTNRAGTAWNGAVPPPGRLRGTGLGWAGVSALLSAQSLVDYTSTIGEPQIDIRQVRRFKEQVYAPMKREKGPSPRDVIRRLKEVISPPRFSVRKSKERIEEALARVKEVWDQAETEVSPAEDWHMLGLCHDLRNMTQCADIYYRAALTRTESRGWHYREDYPNRDDKNWRQWIVIKQKDGNMIISTEKIPFERYKTRVEP